MKIGITAAQRVLRECKVFANLADAELEKIAGFALEKEFEAGATIFKGQGSAEELLVLEEGKIALQMTLPHTETQTSRRLTIDIINKNELVGFSAIVEPYIYTFSAVCLQNVKALSINGKKLRWLLNDNPKIGYEVLKGLIQVVASRLSESRQLLISERSLPLRPA